jgi:glucose uptake protein GlcU
VKSAVEVHPYDLALSILPNLLGFVTGVYALIFGISGKFLREIQEHNNAKATSSKKMNPTILGLNSSFAFPLLIMVVTIFVATFQKIIQTSESLKYLTWLLFFFSLTLTYQLIKTLFRLGRSVLLEKFGNEDA